MFPFFPFGDSPAPMGVRLDGSVSLTRESINRDPEDVKEGLNEDFSSQYHHVTWHLPRRTFFLARPILTNPFLGTNFITEVFHSCVSK